MLQVFSDDPSLPINVCGGCLRKTEDSFSFIKSIEKSQDAFSRQSEAKNPKSSSATSSAHAILKKMKEIGSVSIRRLALPPANEVVTDANAIKAENDDPLIYSKEIEDFKIEKDCDVATIEASSDYSYHASDSDDEYKPKKPRIALSAALPKSKPVQKTSKDFYIDAPISFTCAQCKASFDDFCTLSRHMKERSCIEEEIHMCTICEKQFKNKRNLQNHMRVHRPKETIMCEGCGLPFKSQYDLDQHSEAIHRRVVKMDCIFRCAHCPETFNSHLDLLEHVKKHGRGAKDDEPRLCEICAKECINLRSYKAHMLKHRDVLPFVCNVSQNIGNTFL